MTNNTVVDVAVYEEVLMDCLMKAGFSEAHAMYVIHAATETDVKASEAWAVHAIIKAIQRAEKQVDLIAI